MNIFNYTPSSAITIILPTLFFHAVLCSAKLVKVWSDEFDGTNVDSDKWSFEIGDGCDRNLCGWGNSELESYQKENAYIDDGKLVIEARQEDSASSGIKTYSSARMITKGKGDWKFAKVEVRAKIPKGNGIWPAIWMLPTDDKYGSWPSSGEIDIMENIGREPTKMHATVHYGWAYNNKSETTSFYSLPKGQPFWEDYHTYAVEWVEDKLQFFVDDVSINKVNKKNVEKAGFIYPFNERFFLVLNVAVGGNWPGNPDNTTIFPQKMEVDYVRVYQQQ